MYISLLKQFLENHFLLPQRVFSEKNTYLLVVDSSFYSKSKTNVFEKMTAQLLNEKCTEQKKLEGDINSRGYLTLFWCYVTWAYHELSFLDLKNDESCVSFKKLFGVQFIYRLIKFCVKTLRAYKNKLFLETAEI